MIHKLISTVRKIRKEMLLKSFPLTDAKFAFIGVGSHSIQNLYPVLKFLNVDLKYICSNSFKSANQMSVFYRNTFPITDPEVICSDESVKGVFVCSKPELHGELVSRLLNSNKYVFVEKPLGRSLEELEKIALMNNQNQCLVGLQKRYNVLNKKLKPALKQVISYNGRFLCGAYPEGDPLYDMFIHPVDNLVFLFGEISEVKHMTANDQSRHVLFKHRSGVTGQMELSTGYSWNDNHDQLSIHTEGGVYHASYPSELSFTRYGKSIFSIPAEKIFKQQLTTTHILTASQFTPVFAYNSYHIGGYYDELKTFIKMVESGRTEANASTPGSLLNTYDVLNKLHKP
jgi:virulence factor